MKKIIGIIGAAAVAAGLFAVDFSATVKTSANAFGGSTSATDYEYEVSGDGHSANGYTKESSASFYALQFMNTDQQDDDLLEVHFEGDRAGANFKFYTPLGGGALSARHIDLWFQPIEQLKVTLGNVTLPLFSEGLDGDHVPTGIDAASLDGDTAWMKSLVGRNIGARADFSVAGLTVGAAFAPGADNWWTGKGKSSKEVSSTIDGETESETTEGTTSGEHGLWGIYAKYALEDLGLTIGGGFRDTGTAKWKQIRLGAEFKTDALTAMAQGIVRLEAGDTYNGDGTFAHSTYGTDWNGELHVAAFTFDDYVAYDLGFLKAELAAPVTIRFYDPSYFTLRAKVTIPMDAFTLYAVAGNPQGFNVDGGSFHPYYLTQRYETYNNTECWYMDWGAYLNVGVAFNVGSVELDCGIEGQIYGQIYNAGVNLYGLKGTGSYTTTDIAWAIPFTATISF